MLATKLLPDPQSEGDLKLRLKQIDRSLLSCSSSFINLQVKRPIKFLLTHSSNKWPPNSPQSSWLDIYSIYRSNQQLAEACNKLWACAELMHTTQPSVWKKHYAPLGENFHHLFLGGTVIPTLYYAQISAMISMLSLYGCVPILMSNAPLYSVRTKEGWIVRQRAEYLKLISGVSPRTWHDQIIRTYLTLRQKGVELPPVSSAKVYTLKDLRNVMHYEILGDVKMWRMGKVRRSFGRHFVLVTDTIDKALLKLARVSCVTTGCDARFKNLKDNLVRLRL